MTTVATESSPQAAATPAADQPSADRPSTDLVDLTEPRVLDRSGLHTDRGHTTVGDRVLERIATEAAEKVPGAGRVVPGGVRALLSLGRAPVNADAEVHGADATLRLSIMVEYPAPVRSVVQHVAAAVREAVRELTGVELSRVDVDVTGFTRAHGEPAPRVR